MSTDLDIHVALGPPSRGGPHGALRWLCTSNPFYVVSAGLFLAGLWISFGAQLDDEDTWALMIGLAGYTLLLAVTAFFLVRFGNIWDDVRTVLLLVVLMFLATSVTFDDALVRQPRLGTACYLIGLSLAIVISEALLFGIRLRLPALFRLPYYLILALFFVYPLVLRPLVDKDQPHSEATMWGLYAFSACAGMLFLTLLPALHRGPAYIRDNGSPWPWPLYPWTLFGLFALAVPARAFLLCWSMHLVAHADLHEHRQIFGVHFLVPFGWAIALLLLEAGVVNARRGLLAVGLLLPAALVGVAFLGHRGHDPVYQAFLQHFVQRLGGDPLFIALVGAAGFYGYALLRGVTSAAVGLTLSLVALGFLGPDTLEHGPAYLTWRRSIAGLDYLAGSFAFFAVAFIVSLVKSGQLSRWLTTRWTD